MQTSKHLLVVPDLLRKQAKFTAKAVTGYIGDERPQECLYLGCGWFATCYLPAGKFTEITFEDTVYDFEVYIPVYSNTKASVTLIFVEGLTSFKSRVRIPKFMPKQIQLQDLKLRQTYLNDKADCRKDMKEDNKWLRAYGVLKYSLPGNTKLNYDTKLTEVVKINKNYYGVLAYHVAHKEDMGRNAYGGLRIFTEKTFAQEFVRYR